MPEADKYGHLVDQDGGERTRISGAVAINLRGAVADIVGPDTLRHALERIPDEPRRELHDALPIGWVSIRALEYMMHSVAERAGADVHLLNRDVNRLAAERTFTTIWRVTLRFTTVDLLFSRSRTYFSRTYDRGRLDARVLFPGRGQLAIRGRPGMSRMAREGFAIGVETLLKCAGRRVLRAQASPHEDGADVTLAWKA